MPTHSVDSILEILSDTYPDAVCELHYRNPFELLIATILSAQTTDQRVNEVTSVLFARYPTPQKMLELSPDELEKIIQKIGLFRTKAHHILETCKILIRNYQGQVPQELDQLMKLPGVGRKTAGVVLANAFGIPALPVDTHVLRVSNRLGISHHKDPFQAEKDLTAVIPRERWLDAHHQMIYLGRRICSAKKPQCSACPLKDLCPTRM
ncbi:MAG: Ultraviolet N-glycosylase/AP lyase [Candidatus Dichloromethanomonas elyunquensis]|nr:MAG: Ultraviolet N-glycosylase/AP lyase [Candidatus Dichloromethanomonas elyunquensis]